ncbi:dihydropyrimidine dehydrogenase [Beauveria brongniartii RCEF 3172]|uniref:Dihydropyrimidine dehydrogenase n=1 Tax=Beauveria brongniartii RCEF 3172 TaxID=1081107 RepID=A0A167L0C0_9HYPO|nr:dihydropyrimidine dehydrogenase [Beauveria brongniartii RCEF 3172]
MELAQAFAVEAGLSNLETLAQGLEFNVYKATSLTHSSVVLRVPKFKVFQNANDSNIDARALVRQEAAILALLRSVPVPVPRCHGIYEVDGYPAMVCEFMAADSATAAAADDDDAALGRVAALIHATPIPADWAVELVAMEGYSRTQLPALFLKRMRRRFEVLGELEPQTRDWALDEATLRAVAEPLLEREPPALLHMDLRRANVRVRGGEVTAVFDWTNALLAPPVVDAYRSMEWGAQSETFLQGYRSVRPLEAVSEREEAFLRLDAALVLALVFVSEAPDPDRRAGALRRVQELCDVLRM